MRWLEALKVWNTEHNPGKWCVAKKGSAEYDQVKAIMERGKKAETASEPKAPPRETGKKFEFKRKEAAKPASEPKAPTRDYEAERRMIQEIVAKHVKREMDADRKKALVAAFLKKMVASKRKEKAAKAAEAGKAAPKARKPRAKAPKKEEKEAPAPKAAPAEPEEPELKYPLEMVEKAIRDTIKAVDMGRNTLDRHDFINNFVYFTKMPKEDANKILRPLGPGDFSKAALEKLLNPANLKFILQNYL